MADNNNIVHPSVIWWSTDCVLVILQHAGLIPGQIAQIFSQRAFCYVTSVTCDVIPLLQTCTTSYLFFFLNP